jgi:hypothetical protein
MPSLWDWDGVVLGRIFSGTSPRYLPSRTKIKVKGVGQECPTHTGKVTNSLSGRGAPALHSLCEFQAVGLAEQVPGFAVGIIDVGFAAAFGA